MDTGTASDPDDGIDDIEDDISPSILSRLTFVATWSGFIELVVGDVAWVSVVLFHELGLYHDVANGVAEYCLLTASLKGLERTAARCREFSIMYRKVCKSGSWGPQNSETKCNKSVFDETVTDINVINRGNPGLITGYISKTTSRLFLGGGGDEA